MTTADGYTTAPTTTPDRHTASKAGLAVAAVGIVIFNISPFLNWVSTRTDEGTEVRNIIGYETDSLIPFMAYLGVGLLISMLYAAKRSDRGQHRGLSLVSMAVALAATLQCLAFAVNSMGGLERGDNLDVQLGAFVGLIGAALWAIGSGLLAKEIDGSDDNHAHRSNGLDH